VRSIRDVLAANPSLTHTSTALLHKRKKKGRAEDIEYPWERKKKRVINQNLHQPKKKEKGEREEKKKINACNLTPANYPTKCAEESGKRKEDGGSVTCTWKSGGRERGKSAGRNHVRPGGLLLVLLKKEVYFHF